MNESEVTAMRALSARVEVLEARLKNAQNELRTQEPTDEQIMDAIRDECRDFRWPSTALAIARAVLALRPAAPRAQEPVADVTPKMLRAGQLRSELGRYACAELAGGYELMAELYRVMLAASPAPRAQEPVSLVMPTEAEIDEYLSDYEMRGEDEAGRDGIYTPTEAEKFVIKDAILGLLADCKPAPQPAPRVPLTDEQVRRGASDELAYLPDFESGVRFAERAHGIGQEGGA